MFLQDYGHISFGTYLSPKSILKHFAETSHGFYEAAKDRSLLIQLLYKILKALLHSNAKQES
jgi:hypothetical protein